MSSRQLIRTGILLVGLGWAYWQAPTAVQRLRSWWSPQRASAREIDPARDAAWENLKRQARARQEAKEARLQARQRAQAGATDLVLFAPDGKRSGGSEKRPSVTPSRKGRTVALPDAQKPESTRRGIPAGSKLNPEPADANNGETKQAESRHDPAIDTIGGPFSDRGARSGGSGDPAGVAVPARLGGDVAPRNPYRTIGRTTEPDRQPVLAAGQPDLAALWAAGRPYAVPVGPGRAKPFAIIGPAGSTIGTAAAAARGTDGAEGDALADGASGAYDDAEVP